MKQKALAIISEFNRPIYETKLYEFLEYCNNNSLIPEVIIYDKRRENKILTHILLKRIKRVFIIDGIYNFSFINKLSKSSKIYFFDSCPVQNLEDYGAIAIDDTKIEYEKKHSNTINIFIIKDEALREKKFIQEFRKIKKEIDSKGIKNYKIYTLNSYSEIKSEKIDLINVKVYNDYYNKINNILRFYNMYDKLSPLFYAIYISDKQRKDSSYIHLFEYIENTKYRSYFCSNVDYKILRNDLIYLRANQRFYEEIDKYYKLDLEEKFIFSSFENNKYSCNPKFLSEYIIKNKLKYKIVWIFNKLDNEYVKQLTKQGIKCVEFKSLEYYKEIITSKYIVTNQRMDFNIKKRKGQIYIQTWHGDIALKQIEKKCRQNLTPEWIRVAKKDCYMTDYNICGSNFGYEMIRNSFWYQHKILKIGTFRNDIFFYKKSEIDKLRNKYNLSDKYFYVLYAPTFRNNDSYDYCLDFNKIISSFEKKYNKKVKVIVKLHPNVKLDKKKFKSKDLIIMNDCDVQELLVLSDSLITDYSSVMMDYIFTKKPCYLCMKDYDDYVKNNRNLNFTINELPFVISYSEDELCEAINNLKINEYKKNIDIFLKKMGSIESGTASEQFLKIISKKVRG